jgi:tryptophanase
VGEQFDNTNRGAMFANDYKEKGDNKPDFKGKVEISRERLKKLIDAVGKDGNIVIYLSGWKKVIKQGDRDRPDDALDGRR